MLVQMVDTSSGSSSSSTSSSDYELSTNDANRAHARKKKDRTQTTEHSHKYDVIDDFLITNAPDVTVAGTSFDNGTTETCDDQKLQSSCVLGPYDVICGRNKTAFNNVGNRRFRFTISLALPRFVNAKSRKDKSFVIDSIKTLVHQNGGKFLIMQNEEDENAIGMTTGNVDLSTVLWTELDAKQSHLKVGHALRDAERKMNKAQRQQQKLLRQQDQEKRRNLENIIEPMDQSNPTSENNSGLNGGTSDPLLLHQNNSCDLDDYDLASLSSMSCIDDLWMAHHF